jgi:hypothetical protein
MTGAEHSKRRREVARAAGLCIQCCKRPRIDGMSRCETCRAWNRRDYASRMGHDGTGKHCSSCNTAGHDRRTCPMGAANVQSAYRRVVSWCDECLCAGSHRTGCSEARRRAA